jgi:DNA-binding Lrp family transcriptional regulator
MMRAYIFIKVQPRKAREVAGKIAEIAGVKAAHPCWGLPDVIAQAEVENEAALENLVLGQIQAIEGVTETDTHVVLVD